VIELTGAVTELLAPGSQGRIGAARTRGNLAGRTRAATAWVVVERGSGSMRMGDLHVEVHDRDDVFSASGWSALIGPDTHFELDGDLDATVVWRATDRTGQAAQPSRLIDPATVPDEARGTGATARRVRTYVAHGELVVGETLNPPGGWSSWPPHQHTHEEIYLYRFAPEHGFGVHVALGNDDGATDAPRVVRDGDIVRITANEHPVVAAPGCTMYYLWALAGDTDTPNTLVNPRFT
jgi:5-deoxy-glucuronate isomerase